MTLLYRHANPLRLLLGTAPRRRGRRASLRPSLEPLEDRLVLSASTTIAGNSLNQTLSEVVGSGDLSVVSTSSFNTPPDYLLLSQPGGANFALVHYGSFGNASDFEQLALFAGDGTQVLTDSTVVTQATTGNTPATTQTLSATPFTFNVVDQNNNFSSSGYLYVPAQDGNIILNYTSESVADGNIEFGDCTIVGSSGPLSNSPFGGLAAAGASVVQAVQPALGQTTSINPSPISVTPGTSFYLPVISTAGFFLNPTPDNPGSIMVYYQDGTPGYIHYTSISPSPTGGEILNCVPMTTGTIETIGQFGKTSGPTANVQWGSAAPISFTFTNNSGQVPIYAAIAGQEINTQSNNTVTYGYLYPKMNGDTPGSPESLVFMPFSAGTGDDVPTFAIFPVSADYGTQTLLIPNLPQDRLSAVRIVFSVSEAPTIPIINGQPSFPAAGNGTDPNNSIRYDFVEFSERYAPNDGALFINTTQVDQVGIPFTMNVSPADSVKSDGVGIDVSSSELSDAYTSYIAGMFESSDEVAELDAFQNLDQSLRLLNPSDAITSMNPNDPTPKTLEAYFDAALSAFFSKFSQSGAELEFQRDGYYFVGHTITGYTPAPYSTDATLSAGGNQLVIDGPTQMTFTAGEIVTGAGIPTTATVTSVATNTDDQTVITLKSRDPLQSTNIASEYTFQVPGSFTVLQLQQANSSWQVIAGGQEYEIYAPYFSNGSAPPEAFPVSGTLGAAPPWVAPRGGIPSFSGSMVFANNGVFTDGTAQAADEQISGTGATGQILLDIENTIVSAFNRGVANMATAGTDVTATWDNNELYYQAPLPDGSNWSNYYAGFLHNGVDPTTGQLVSETIPGGKVGLAYGFAYDDQGGNDPTLTSLATSVDITLYSVLGGVSVEEVKPTVFVVEPKVVEVSKRADVLAFGLKRVLPDTTYTVIVFLKTDAGDVAVGTPLAVKSNKRGRIRDDLKLPFRLKPGTYRILVRDLQDTDLDVWSRPFRIRRRK
jgi:Beta-1,3-glucanase